MKKYITIIAICLIYYWPVEVVVIGVAGTWYTIVKVERRNKQLYTTMPGTWPDDEYISITRTDTIRLTNGRTIEFQFDSLTEKK